MIDEKDSAFGIEFDNTIIMFSCENCFQLIKYSKLKQKESSGNKFIEVLFPIHKCKGDVK